MDDDHYVYDDQTFGTDFKDSDRLGGWGRSDEGDIGEFQGFNSFLSNEERIMKKLQEDLTKFQSDLHINLSAKDIHMIERLIKLDPRIEFKNNLAFLLGYYVVSKDKSIRKADVDQMYKLCDGKGKIITKADIIRYARFIANMM
jgi:hypothetical protein